MNRNGRLRSDSGIIVKNCIIQCLPRDECYYIEMRNSSRCHYGILYMGRIPDNLIYGDNFTGCDRLFVYDTHMGTLNIGRISIYERSPIFEGSDLIGYIFYDSKPSFSALDTIIDIKILKRMRNFDLTQLRDTLSVVNDRLSWYSIMCNKCWEDLPSEWDYTGRSEYLNKLENIGDSDRFMELPCYNKVRSEKTGVGIAPLPVNPLSVSLLLYMGSRSTSINYYYMSDEKCRRIGEIVWNSTSLMFINMSDACLFEGPTSGLPIQCGESMYDVVMELIDDVRGQLNQMDVWRLWLFARLVELLKPHKCLSKRLDECRNSLYGFMKRNKYFRKHRHMVQKLYEDSIFDNIYWGFLRNESWFYSSLPNHTIGSDGTTYDKSIIFHCILLKSLQD